MTSTTHQERLAATPADLCNAARAGNVASIERILADRPELLVIDNPHNWDRTATGHEVRGAQFKKPVEVAAFFNQPKAVAALLEISHQSPVIRQLGDERLLFDGHFNALRIARVLQQEPVIRVIQHDVLTQLDSDPQLLNRAGDDGRTVLHYASEQGCMRLVRELLQRGADADPPQRLGRRVIHAVLDEPLDDERRTVAGQLISAGAEFDLWIATALDDMDRVRELLVGDSSLANKHFRPDCQGYSEGFPLVRACARGNRQIVELLLDHGADVNAELDVNEPPEFGMPIIAAVYARNFDIANLLLDRGASVHAHPDCAPPLIDMLYCASVADGPGWLALWGLQYVTDDPRSHLQPNDGGLQEVVALYERVLSTGATPSIEAHIQMRNYAEIERLLRREIKRGTGDKGGSGRVYECLYNAAWLGEVKTIQMALTLDPKLLSPAHANDFIAAAIRSHNRDGSFTDYRRIIEMNLRYLKEQSSPITVHPLGMLANDFLQRYSYGTCPDLPTLDDMLNLAALFLEYGVDVDQRHQETGRTALTEAVDNGHTEYVRLLLDHGATIHRGDPPESNPVSLAQQHGFAEIIDLMSE